MTFLDIKSKANLLEQLVALSQPSKNSITDVKYDEFGNEILTKCLGNDGNTYDIHP